MNPSHGYDSLKIYIAVPTEMSTLMQYKVSIEEIRRAKSLDAKLNRTEPCHAIWFKLNRRDIIIQAYGLIQCVYLVFAFGIDAKNK